MLKMILKLDEEKVKANGYDLREIYNDVNGLINDCKLTVVEDGIYTDSGVDEFEDGISFMAIAPILAEREWMRYAKEWSWYEDGDEEDLDDDFEDDSEDDDFPDDLLKTFEIMTE